MASVIISSIERILISIAKRERNVDICSEYRLVVLRALTVLFIVHQFKEIETQVLFDKFSRQVKSST